MPEVTGSGQVGLCVKGPATRIETGLLSRPVIAAKLAPAGAGRRADATGLSLYLADTVWNLVPAHQPESAPSPGVGAVT